VEPLRDKTESEKVFVLANRPADDPLRVLWENFAQIRAEVEEETGGLFYLRSYKERQRIVNDKVADIISSLPDEVEVEEIPIGD
jgi:hypothetical protein